VSDPGHSQGGDRPRLWEGSGPPPPRDSAASRGASPSTADATGLKAGRVGYAKAMKSPIKTAKAGRPLPRPKDPRPKPVPPKPQPKWMSSPTRRLRTRVLVRIASEVALGIDGSAEFMLAATHSDPNSQAEFRQFLDR
jgi:hypothetical protein